MPLTPRKLRTWNHGVYSSQATQNESWILLWQTLDPTWKWPYLTTICGLSTRTHKNWGLEDRHSDPHLARLPITPSLSTTVRITTRTLTTLLLQSPYIQSISSSIPFFKLWVSLKIQSLSTPPKIKPQKLHIQLKFVASTSGTQSLSIKSQWG